MITKSLSTITSKEKHTTICVKDLSVGYISNKKANAVCGPVNFELKKGELLGIIGINGIGKSTLIRTLATIQPRLAGSVFLHGKPIEEYHPKSLAKTVSVVLTEPLASMNLSVLELVSLGRQPHTNWLGNMLKEDVQKVHQTLKEVKLENLKDKKCYELSDGQLQRVLIARALCQDTDIVILDEPTTHLDLYHKVEIIKLLKQVAIETGKTILFSSHEIDLAIQLCHKIVILKESLSIFGDPCSLIEQKSFDDLFPSDSITFNAETGSFKIVS